MEAEALPFAVPADWTSTTVGDLCSGDNGTIQTGPFGSQLHASDYVDDGVPSVMPQDLVAGLINDSQIARIAPEDRDRLYRYVLRAGDLVYSRRGDLRRRAIVQDREDGWLCGTGCLMLRLDGASGTASRYLFYALGHFAVQEWIERHSVGATMLNLNTGIMAGCPVPLPSLREQCAIGSVLGALDDKIQSNRRLADCARDLLPLAFQRCVSGARDSTTLGQLGEIMGGGTPRSKHAPFWEPAEVPWITPKDMTALNGAPVVACGERAISREGLEGSSAKLLPEGAVVFTSRATLGVVAVTEQPLATNQGFISIVPNERFGPVFVYCTLVDRREAISDQANGSTFLEVNKTNFKAVPCPLPDASALAELREVGGTLLSVASSALAERRTLTAIRDALLPKLVSGRIRVPLSDDPEEGLGTAAEALDEDAA